MRVYKNDKEDCLGPRLADGWMNIICDTRGVRQSHERRDIYLLSQQEPYASAPSIQFYMHKMGILLVARAAFGEVTYWDYEKKRAKITSEQVRRFLGEKWYTP